VHLTGDRGAPKNRGKAARRGRRTRPSDPSAPLPPQLVAIAKKELKSSHWYYLYLQKQPNAIGRTGGPPLPVRITDYLVNSSVSNLDQLLADRSWLEGMIRLLSVFGAQSLLN
jgi:hypothetical protein